MKWFLTLALLALVGTTADACHRGPVQRLRDRFVQRERFVLRIVSPRVSSHCTGPVCPAPMPTPVAPKPMPKK